MRRLLLINTLIAGLMLVTACGKSGDEKKQGNAGLSMSYVGDMAVDGTDMTIKKMRVWRSNDNSESPGVVSAVDMFKVELWFVLTGEEKSRYVAIDNLAMDDLGNLYFEGGSPGTIAYTTADDRLNSEGPLSYTVTADNALIQTEYAAFASWAEVTSSGGVTSTVQSILKAHELSETPWTDVRNRSAASSLMATRVRYVENTDLATKAKMGCLYKEPDTSGNMQGKKFIFKDVELGNVFQDKEGRSTGNSADVIGNDDKLWIPWTESWYLTGVNVAEKKVRVMRARSAPFYANRELPGVDTSDTTAKASGMDGLIRTCNYYAARAGGSFSLVSLTGTAMSPTLKVGTANTFCQQLLTDNTANPNAVRLDTFTGCTFTGLGTVAAGTWTGAAHTGPITNAGSGYTHIEQSKIVELAF